MSEMPWSFVALTSLIVVLIIVLLPFGTLESVGIGIAAQALLYLGWFLGSRHGS